MNIQLWYELNLCMRAQAPDQYVAVSGGQWRSVRKLEAPDCGFCAQLTHARL